MHWRGQNRGGGDKSPQVYGIKEALHVLNRLSETNKNNGSSDGIINFKIYYSGFTVKANVNFNP
jgi:hypothetical protein